jgi:hypothetical protein
VWKEEVTQREGTAAPARARTRAHVAAAVVDKGLLGISLRSATGPIDDTSTGKLMGRRARRAPA